MANRPTRYRRRLRGAALLHAAAAEAGRAVQRGVISLDAADAAVRAIVVEAVISGRFTGDVQRLHLHLEQTCRRAEATA